MRERWKDFWHSLLFDQINLRSSMQSRILQLCMCANSDSPPPRSFLKKSLFQKKIHSLDLLFNASQKIFFIHLVSLPD